MAALPGYLAFFCLENAVRELINERMTEVHGANWWDTKASSPLRKKVQDRRSKEGSNRWHIARGEHELYYTDFGDLRSFFSKIGATLKTYSLIKIGSATVLEN